jgi:hypothetical protein
MSADMCISGVNPYPHFVSAAAVDCVRLQVAAELGDGIDVLKLDVDQNADLSTRLQVCCRRWICGLSIHVRMQMPVLTWHSVAQDLPIGGSVDGYHSSIALAGNPDSTNRATWHCLARCSCYDSVSHLQSIDV